MHIDPTLVNAITTVVLYDKTNGKWMDTTIGKWLTALLAIVGGIIVVVAIFKAIGSFLQGQMGKGIKTIAGAAVIAAFMFFPELITGLINFIGTLVGKLLDTGGEIDKTGGNTTNG